GLALSPDAKWALALVASPAHLVLLPTGAGEPRPLPAHDIAEYYAATWFPDGRRFAFVGSVTGGGQRGYVTSIDGGAPRAVTPEGGDGRVVRARARARGRVWTGSCCRPTELRSPRTARSGRPSIRSTAGTPNRFPGCGR